MPVGEKFCYTYTHTHIDACVSLCVCVCVAECKRQYVARYKTTYRPQSEAHKHSQTHIRAHSLTHTRTYGSSQNAQAKIAANYMRLQSSTAQHSTATGHFALIFFSPLLLLLLLLLLFLLLACCFRRQSAAQLFLCRFFSIALTFGSVLGKSFAVFSSPRFYIPIQRHTRSLFCFAAAAATTSCPQITPHPPRQQRQNVNNNSTIP